MKLTEENKVLAKLKVKKASVKKAKGSEGEGGDKRDNAEDDSDGFMEEEDTRY